MITKLEQFVRKPRGNLERSAIGALPAAGFAVFDPFLRKAIVLISIVTGVLMYQASALAGFTYVTHWDHFDTSGANPAFDGPTHVAFLKSNGNMLIVDSNAGACSSTPVPMPLS